MRTLMTSSQNVDLPLRSAVTLCGISICLQEFVMSTGTVVISGTREDLAGEESVVRAYLGADVRTS